MRPKCYLAAPFFNAEQLALVVNLEIAIEKAGWSIFSPRKGNAAIVMNAMLEEKREPSADLRQRVFFDNYSNIDEADLLLAVIDDFDVGVMWEVGYAFARHVPIVTHTGRDYGCNLMLAHSIIGHTKSLEAVYDVLEIGNPALAAGHKVEEYGIAIARIQQYYKSEFALKEGPDERNQF